MKIKQLYTLPADHVSLIEKPDGTFYTFLLSPARPLTDKDLTLVKTPLPRKLYLATTHAKPYSGVCEQQQMRTFGLEK